MDIGVLILRILLAGVLFIHGTQKAMGWFSGPGLDAAETTFDKFGQRPARTMVKVAVTCELFAATSLLFGLANSLGTAVATGTMLVASVSMNRLSNAFWNTAGGGEYPLVLAVLAAAVGFTGPGRFSVDNAIAASWHEVSTDSQAWLGGLALVLALLAAAPILIRSSRARRHGVT